MDLYILLVHEFLWADYRPTQALVFHSSSYISMEVLLPLPDHKNNSHLSVNLANNHV